MVYEPTTAPVLFDRYLLCSRLGRAQRLGPASFLLDRVAEDMAERLNAVLRDFKSAAEIGTPGDQVGHALAARFEQYKRVDLSVRGDEPLAPSAEAFDLVPSALADP